MPEFCLKIFFLYFYHAPRLECTLVYNNAIYSVPFMMLQPRLAVFK